MRQNTNKRGLTLLITLLLMSVLLGISASILNVTLRQFQLSGIARASEMAFQAAQAGTECAMYNDIQAPTLFDVDPTGGEVTTSQLPCFKLTGSDLVNNNTTDKISSGEERRYQFEWDNGTPGSSKVCTEISIYKFSKNTGVLDPGGQMLEMKEELGKQASDMCPEGAVGAPVECTIIKSRGYNTNCGDLSNPRTVEREITQRY